VETGVYESLNIDWSDGYCNTVAAEEAAMLEEYWPLVYLATCEDKYMLEVTVAGHGRNVRDGHGEND
jgi:hypothetical protein